MRGVVRFVRFEEGRGVEEAVDAVTRRCHEMRSQCGESVLARDSVMRD